MNHYEGQSWGDDFSLYLNQARSIIYGTVEITVYNNIYAVRNSTVSTFSPESYPWGFPLLLSPFFYIFGIDFKFFKILEAIILIAFLFVFDRLLSNKLKNPERIALISLIGLNQVFILHTNDVLAEIPFLFFSALTLYVIQQASKTNFPTPLNILIGSLMLFTFFIRSEGIALVGAFLLYQLFIIKQFSKIDFKSFMLFASPHLVFLFLYFLSKAIFPTGFTSHLEFLENFNIETSLHHTDLIFKLLGIFLNENINLINSILVIGFFLIGLVSRWREDFLFIAYWFIVLFVLFIWPYFYNRYMYSLIPLFCYFFARGCGLVSVWLVGKNYSVYLLLLLAGLNLFSLVEKTAEHNNDIYITYGPASADSKAMYDFIKNKVPQDEVVVFPFPRVINFYTLRKSIFEYESADIIMEKGDWLVLFKNWNHNFQISNISEITRHEGFEHVFENRLYIIYKIKKGPKLTIDA
ncbi:hypothetical protein [uncultured Algoriphagus sp.]|uniref:hypothetical protein n=1 Tax=uncultured Algoriphagus sp. TaxID=417365 RepID=UPI0030EE32A8|tara:strand:+ start:7661 stop:9058 length:1398 start_codon:yes stop_codon:yes gene_type:complete